MEERKMKDSQFLSAKEKQRVLKQWMDFLASGLKWEKFHEALYSHLIQHCSFIAHYNRQGFYGTYFEEGERIIQFLSQFDKRNAGADGIPRSVEYGMTYWATDADYTDVNGEMIEIASGYIPALVEKAARRQRDDDVARALALLNKHGMSLEL